MGIEPSGYGSYLPVLERVFKNGPDPFIQPTGFIGSRLVLDTPEENLNPYYSTPSPGRAKAAGDFGIYLGDTVETCKQELRIVEYPRNSWELRFSYDGNILNIDSIPCPHFREMFLDIGKHECSQYVRRYLKEKSLDTGFDSIGWSSAPGIKLGTGGITYIYTSGVDPKFRYIDKKRMG